MGDHARAGSPVGFAAIKSVFDLTTPEGGTSGKAVQLTATADIADLSVFGVGVANNGGGTDGIEVNLPAVPLLAGQSFWCVRNAAVISAYLGIDLGTVDVK